MFSNIKVCAHQSVAQKEISSLIKIKSLDSLNDQKRENDNNLVQNSKPLLLFRTKLILDSE